MSAGGAYRGLGWAHGALTVQRLGAMLAPLTFVLARRPPGLPMHVAPWAGEPGTAQLPGILRRLRGEWPCVPFGYSVPADGVANDLGAFCERRRTPARKCTATRSNHDWHWQPAADGSLVAELGLSRHRVRCAGSSASSPPTRRRQRSISRFRIDIREACRLPIGLHPVFRLPSKTGQRVARAWPLRSWPDLSRHASNLRAALRHRPALRALWPPCRGERRRPSTHSRLPFAEDTEELLQLNGVAGRCALANREEGYRVRLSWQKEHFPSLLLWFSNRGRKMEPWNGRHVAIGIEPICSPVRPRPSHRTRRQSDRAHRARRPPATSPLDEIFTTRYRIEAESALRTP